MCVRAYVCVSVCVSVCPIPQYTHHACLWKWVCMGWFLQYFHGWPNSSLCVAHAWLLPIIAAFVLLIIDTVLILNESQLPKHYHWEKQWIVLDTIECSSFSVCRGSFRLKGATKGLRRIGWMLDLLIICIIWAYIILMNNLLQLRLHYSRGGRGDGRVNYLVLGVALPVNTHFSLFIIGFDGCSFLPTQKSLCKLYSFLICIIINSGGPCIPYEQLGGHTTMIQWGPSDNTP